MIKSAGYDAQQQMLEIEFANNGQIWQFDNVPEDIWYRFRSHHLPELFFHNFIPLFVFPVCLGSLPNFLHSSFRIMSHNEIITQEAAEIAISPAAFCVTK